MTSIWKYYDVSFHFLGKLCASVPANPELIKVWLESRQPRVKAPGGKTINEINEEVLASLPEEQEQEQANMLVFQRQNGNLVLRAATVRAHIKDCARIYSGQLVGRIKGERSFATKVINGVYHDESQYWLPILNRGGVDPVASPDGIHEKPVRFRLPDGRVASALKAFEFIMEPVVRFRLKVLGSNPGREDLVHLFEYGGVHGYGGERGDGEGRYRFIIKENENGN